MLEKDRARKRTYNRAYYAAHKDALRKYQVEWRKAHPDYVRDYAAGYREANKEKIRSKQKVYYETHKDRLLAIYREQYLQDPEKKRRARKGYCLRHPAEVAAAKAKERAMKRSATVGDTKAIRAVYRQARENKHIRCYLCGEFIPLGERHVDHIHPLAKGGSHTASNLAIACAKCNLTKHTKLPADLGLLL